MEGAGVGRGTGASPIAEGSGARLRVLRPTRVMDELRALADCWHFEIEVDALDGIRWEWYDSPGLLRMGRDFTPNDRAWLAHAALRQLLSGIWMP